MVRHRADQIENSAALSGKLHHHRVVGGEKNLALAVIELEAVKHSVL